jgi:hypothetical protein
MEGIALPEASPVLERITDEFWACVRAERQHPSVRLTGV